MVNSYVMAELGCDDADQLSQLHQQYFEPFWSKETFQDFFTKDAWSGTFGFGAFENKKLIGFIVGRTVEGCNDIFTLAVIKKKRRQNIALNLIKKYLNHAQCPTLLEVSIDNMAAISCYEKAGFRKVNVRKKYYNTRNGQKDAQIMQHRRGEN